MILGGGELGRSQGGNNNAYCQDSPTSWFDWDAADVGLTAYTRRADRVPPRVPALRRGAYLADPGYVVWFTPVAARWSTSTARPRRTSTHTAGPCSIDVLILVNGSPHQGSRHPRQPFGRLLPQPPAGSVPGRRAPPLVAEAPGAAQRCAGHRRRVQCGPPVVAG